jgi:hypothetical protein
MRELEIHRYHAKSLFKDFGFIAADAGGDGLFARVTGIQWRGFNPLQEGPYPTAWRKGQGEELG